MIKELFGQISLFDLPDTRETAINCMPMDDAPLSLFDLPKTKESAISCMTGEKMPLTTLESWMKRLIPTGKYAALVGSHTIVLYPTRIKKVEDIEQGHLYHHYTVGGELLNGTYVGQDTESDCMEKEIDFS